MMKLKQLCQNFNPKHLWARLNQNDIEVLHRILPDMFPKDDATYRWVEQVKAAEHRPNNVYTAEYLPFHTRDIDWLTHYACQAAQDLAPHTTVRFPNARRFVAGSMMFHRQRDAYEQRLVKAQIKYLNQHVVSNGIMDKNFQLSYMKYEPNYDLVFHSAVVNAMHNLGIDRRTTEMGLEKNADMWRQITMTQAFDNVHCMHTTNDYSKDEHFRVWLPLREYQYYQHFRPAIENMNSATENMKLSPEKIDALEAMNLDYEKRYGVATRAFAHNTIANMER